MVKTRFDDTQVPSFASWKPLLEQAFQEDWADCGDISAQFLPSKKVKAHVLCREDATICGLFWAQKSWQLHDRLVQCTWRVDEGEQVSAGSILGTIEGHLSSLVSAERIALNGLQLLSATATQTAAYVEAMSHACCHLLDTRKTIPGWRILQKYAVVCGGGYNHRMGLYDAIMLKENHLAAFTDMKGAIAAARAQYPSMPLIIEVEHIKQLISALQAGASHILLDNFSLTMAAEAVHINQQQQAPAFLEFSGNVDLHNIRDIAASGVDAISVGALTKHVKAVDLSLRVEDA